MDIKQEILKLLELLKKAGFTRAKIEAELGYSGKYITQQLSKGGNERLLKSLQKLRNNVAHGVGISNLTLANEIGPAESEDSYRAKYIKRLEKENQLLEEIVRNNQEIIRTNLTLVLATVRTISVRQLGTGNVALKSLERIEKSVGLKPGSLVKEADKEIGQIEREAFAHDNASAVGS